MKKIILLAIIALIGCVDGLVNEPFEYTCLSEGDEGYVTFEEVLQPFIELHGANYELYEFLINGYSYKNVWWWSQGVQISFEIDGCVGWAATDEYYFPPI